MSPCFLYRYLKAKAFPRQAELSEPLPLPTVFPGDALPARVLVTGEGWGMFLYWHFYNTLSLTASHVSLITVMPLHLSNHGTCRRCSLSACVPRFLPVHNVGQGERQFLPQYGFGSHFEALSGAADCFSGLESIKPNKIVVKYYL